MVSIKFPVQIQAANDNADDSQSVICVCKVDDEQALQTVFIALCKQYLHVLAWELGGMGRVVRSYDNR